jgi:hypothetical protein
MLYILSIVTEGETVTFHVVTSFPTHFTPVSLEGDIVGLSDGRSGQISIWNWRDNKHATLSCAVEDNDRLQVSPLFHTIYLRIDRLPRSTTSAVKSYSPNLQTAFLLSAMIQYLSFHFQSSRQGTKLQ